MEKVQLTGELNKLTVSLTVLGAKVIVKHAKKMSGDQIPGDQAGNLGKG